MVLYIVVLKDKSENCVCHLCSLCFICLPIYIFGLSQILMKSTESKIILFHKIVNHTLIQCWIFIWSLYNLHITFRPGKQFRWLHFPSIIFLFQNIPCPNATDSQSWYLLAFYMSNIVIILLLQNKKKLNSFIHYIKQRYKVWRSLLLVESNSICHIQFKLQSMLKNAKPDMTNESQIQF